MPPYKTRRPGIVSIEGTGDSVSQDIIRALSDEPLVYSLSLSHSAIGDVACAQVFDFLRRQVKIGSGIVEVDLRKCSLGDDALSAIGRFLAGNSTLQTLLLQANNFGHDKRTVHLFVEAINASHLAKLSLSSNPSGNTFVPWLLDRLDSSFLHTLELSMTGLQPECVPCIVTYIRSPGCRLRSFALSGNALGFEGMKDTVNALRHNHTLTSLDIHANRSYWDSTSLETHKPIFNEKTSLETRNKISQGCVAEDAFHLLYYARALLLRREGVLASPPSSRTLGPLNASSDPAELNLPTEIILHVLSFLAPSLSVSQRIRVYDYASDFATLPQLLPSLLPRRPRILAPSGSQRVGLPREAQDIREEGRQDWLRMLGCDAYDPGLAPVPSRTPT